MNAYVMSHPFENTPLGQTSRMKQELNEQYKSVAEEGRNKMMTLYVECAESQMRKAALDFDILWEQIVNVDYRTPVDQRITPMMFDLGEGTLRLYSCTCFLSL